MWDEQTIRNHLSMLCKNKNYLKEQSAKFPNDKSYQNDISLLEVRIIQICMILQIDSKDL